MNDLAPLKSGGRIGAIIPQTIEEVFRLSQGIAASGLAPKGMDKPEQITVAILTGLEVGLPPMFAIQKIAVVNGRPCIYGDAVPALLWSRGFKIEEGVEGEVAFCEVTRPDGSTIRRTFSVAEAKKAGLAGKAGPWTQYPTRMLQMRARGYACRDGAADVLGGLYLSEEAEDIVDITPDAPKRKSSSSAKKDGTDKVFNEIRAELQSAKNLIDLEEIRERNMEVWDTLPSRWAELLNMEYDDKAAEFQAETTPEVAAE